jgi:hypothetical protein
MDGEELRHPVLGVVQRHALERGAFNSKRILDDVESYCRQNRLPLDDQALLTFFYDLFRNGYLSWGLNLNNPDPPWCHLTSQGRAALTHFSRDPANPDGYLAYLASVATLSPLAKSYIEEALQKRSGQVCPHLFPRLKPYWKRLVRGLAATLMKLL